MKSSVALALLLSSATSAELHRRTSSQVLADLTNSNNNALNLTNWLQADYTGVNPWIINAINADVGLYLSIVNCSTNAQNSTAFSQSDSAAICNYAAGTFYNNTRTLINAMRVAKPKYLVANLTGIGQAQFGVLKNKTRDCFANLAPKLASSVAATCNNAAASLDQMYADILVPYNTTTCN